MPLEDLRIEGCLEWTLQLVQPHTTDTVRLLLRGKLPKNQDSLPGLAALDSLPLRDTDQAAVGRHVPWWQDWVEHAEPDDPFWEAVDFTGDVVHAPPTAMIGGWHDIFLPWQIKDYAAMQAARRPVTLTIGPWAHSTLEAWGEGVRQALSLFRAQLLDQPAALRAPVRLYVMGAEEWREYDSWPPPGLVPVAFYFSAGGGLSTKQRERSEPDDYVYDPADPTPAVHGPRFSGVRPLGDMARLESRSDILLFTAEPLPANLEVIGPVSAELFFRSSLEHTDFFLVLCDVDPSDRCTNVCDGYVRIRSHPARPSNDGVWHVHVEFWPTAYRYCKGHRMRVIVASGAHPRYARNLGSAEPLADAVTFHTAHQRIFHDPQHLSRIVLPIGGETGISAVP